MIKRLLVGLGEKESSSAAIQHAIQIAGRHDAQLVGMSVFDLGRLSDVGPQPVGAEGSARNLQKHRLKLAEKRIREVEKSFVKQCTAAAVPHRLISAEGNPFELFSGQGRYVDLTVSGFGRLFEHGVVREPSDELVQLIRIGVGPIIAVFGPYRPIRRVVVAYSGSQGSARSMRRFIQSGLWPEASLKIILFEGSETLLEEAAAYCRSHGRRPCTERYPGSPVEGVLAAARQWNADLIVAGSSEKSLLRQKLFGDTTLHLTRHSDRSLFLC